MESGSVIGTVGALSVLGTQALVVASYLRSQVTEPSAAKYFGLAILASSFVCAFFIGLAILLNITDSSHGAATLGLPILSSLAGLVVTLLAMLVGGAIRRRAR